MTDENEDFVAWIGDWTGLDEMRPVPDSDPDHEGPTDADIVRMEAETQVAYERDMAEHYETQRLLAEQDADYWRGTL